MPTSRNTPVVLQGSKQIGPGLEWSPDGSRLATTGDDNEICLWDAATGALGLRLQATSRPAAGLVFSPDGGRLATVLGDGRLGLWDVHSGRSLPVISDAVFGDAVLAWSRDRSVLACAARAPDQALHLWECYSGRPKPTFYVHHEVFCISWSPDGKLVAAAGDSPYINIWNVGGGGLRKKLEGLAQAVFALAWSPTGNCIASGGDDNYVYLWDVAKGEVSEVLDGHTDAVVALDFSGNGEYLASKALDGTLRIWKLGGNGDDQQVIHERADRNHHFKTLAFHPRALTIASAEWPGGRVRIRSFEPPSNLPEPHLPAAELPVEVFLSYSRKDDKLRDKLEPFLSGMEQKGLIRVWSDRKILPGADWRKEIDAHLNSSGIVLLLVTQNFINSEYCSLIETARSMEAKDAGKTRVVPILMRPTDWEDSQFSGLQLLPDRGKPVMKWSDTDEALLNVAKGIRRVVDDLRGKRQE